MFNYPGPYSQNLMTRVILGLGPPTTHDNSSHEEPVRSWEEKVFERPLTFGQSSSILSDVVNKLDKQPAGWFPPRYPSLRPSIDQNIPSAPSTRTPPVHCSTRASSPWDNTSLSFDLPEFDTFDSRYPDIHQDDIYPVSPVPSNSTPSDSTSTGSTPSNSTSTGSTSSGSAFTRSPSPIVFVPTRESSAISIRTTEGENDSREPSPLLALREKERRDIRRGSGVKPKAKVPQTRKRRSAEAGRRSRPPSEMVRCRWAGCTQRLHVDYVSVRHWGKHIRDHYARQPDMIQCEWGHGCGAVIHRSSMWKHIVVHEPKFKIRCPRGCDVFTRSDMMRRHLQSCSYTPGRAADESESEEEEEMEVEEDSLASDYDGDGDNVGGGKR